MLCVVKCGSRYCPKGGCGRPPSRKCLEKSSSGPIPVELVFQLLVIISL